MLETWICVLPADRIGISLSFHCLISHSEVFYQYHQESDHLIVCIILFIIFRQLTLLILIRLVVSNHLLIISISVINRRMRQRKAK
jgi:hypothetical protein